MQPIERPARYATVLASISAAVFVLAACNRLGNDPPATKNTNTTPPAVIVQPPPAAGMEPVEDPIQPHASQAY